LNENAETKAFWLRTSVYAHGETFKSSGALKPGHVHKRVPALWIVLCVQAAAAAAAGAAAAAAVVVVAAAAAAVAAVVQ